MEIRTAAERIAAENGFIQEVCSRCLGKGACHHRDNRSPIGFWIEEPCHNCLGSGHVWASSGLNLKYSDSMLLEAYLGREWGGVG